MYRVFLGWLDIIELRKSNETLSIFLHPPHPPLSPDYGGEDKGEGVSCDGNLRSVIDVKVNNLRRDENGD